ncbi:MAG: IPT/TIG domain-containing protein [Sandaracinus sp.]|nr:IPT/TIG domain-containing protein [Myxococcales bacterium]MCB9599223.1 IPT/TIG domain-containing protein [Sandaracinus sp.]MCB9614829.1 IPT/TIG domain-containing protein [Sandaracinus sp.]MCB9621157.1 IPT/TIG domain-containing protein [Sandaracinus sp.]MCB9631496.1 IPT/TIG domain-containing protein [Sandaracinus sp.]
MIRLSASIVLSACLSLGLVACGDGGGEVAILNIDPPNGATQGRPIKIEGRNFRTDIGYTVFFGTRRSEQVTLIDPETMVVLAPQVDDPGVVDITIRADNGDAFIIHDAFEYQAIAGGIVDRMGEGPEKQQGGGLAY